MLRAAVFLLDGLELIQFSSETYRKPYFPER
jgi:hypothetical protein